MGWMCLLCLRFRTRWRMSSSSPAGGGGVAGVFLVAPPVACGVCCCLECDVLWRQG